MRPNPRTIVFLARSLDRGGAERQLVTLAIGLARRGHDVAVALFYAGGAYEGALANSGVRIIRLEKKGRWDLLLFATRLFRVLIQERPRLLHGYLSVPNILAATIGPLLPGTRVVWGVRAGFMDLAQYDWLARLTYWLERRFALFADSIIVNSYAGKQEAIGKGFPADKITVIFNGIDTDYFQFDPEGRNKVRSSWGIRADEIVIGLAARLDPMKGHSTFLEAAGRLVHRCQNVRLICVGEGVGRYVSALKERAERLGLNPSLIWAGPRDDMPAVYSAFDIACSSSTGEGFSNAIAEAMACNLPTIATDVGDSARIVGDTVSVVTPEDPASLAAALERLAKMPANERRALGAACRERIVSEFGIDRLIQRTEQALELA